MNTPERVPTVDEQLAGARSLELSLRSVITEMKQRSDADFSRIITLAAERDQFRAALEGTQAIVKAQADQLAALQKTADVVVEQPVLAPAPAPVPDGPVAE